MHRLIVNKGDDDTDCARCVSKQQNGLYGRVTDIRRWTVHGTRDISIKRAFKGRILKVPPFGRRITGRVAVAENRIRRKRIAFDPVEFNRPIRLWP